MNLPKGSDENLGSTKFLGLEWQTETKRKYTFSNHVRTALRQDIVYL